MGLWPSPGPDSPREAFKHVLMHNCSWHISLGSSSTNGISLTGDVLANKQTRCVLQVTRAGCFGGEDPCKYSPMSPHADLRGKRGRWHRRMRGSPNTLSAPTAPTPLGAWCVSLWHCLPACHVTPSLVTKPGTPHWAVDIVQNHNPTKRVTMHRTWGFHWTLGEECL